MRMFYVTVPIVSTNPVIIACPMIGCARSSCYFLDEAFLLALSTHRRYPRRCDLSSTSWQVVLFSSACFQSVDHFPTVRRLVTECRVLTVNAQHSYQQLHESVQAVSLCG